MATGHRTGAASQAFSPASCCRSWIWNSGGSSTIPGRLAAPLAVELRPQLDQLAERLGGPAVGWAETGAWLETVGDGEEIPYPFQRPGAAATATTSSLIL